MEILPTIGIAVIIFIVIRTLVNDNKQIKATELKESFGKRYNELKNIGILRQQTKKIVEEFIALCFVTKSALQGKIDTDVIMSFKRVILQYIDSNDFNDDFSKGYDMAIKRYGSVEAIIYNLIISMLIHGPQNKTTEDMQRMANAKLESLKDNH